MNLKRNIFDACLCTGGTVAVLVAPADGLDLPFEFDVSARLDYGLQLAKPIPDLEVTEAGIRATLSFSNEPRATFVPWDAVIAIGLADGSFSAGWSRKRDETAEPSRPRLRAV